MTRQRSLKHDLLAGVSGAISSVPDGMSASLLAGVNPVHGLYASLFGRVGGGLTSSSRLMVITTTSAAALAAGSALQGVAAEDKAGALFVLTVLAGVVMIVAGLLKLGRYTRFVPHSVMIGFLTGVAFNILFGQLPQLMGAEVSGDLALTKFFNLVTHPSAIDLASLAAGLAALGLMVGLSRSRLAPYAALIAVAIPSAAVVLLGADTVKRVQDIGDIPQGLPMPVLPHLSDLSLDVVTGALAVAALVLIQGAGVSESAPNPDGTRADADRDFLAQGVGNVLAGLFRGQPVGGSVGQTAVSVASGARTRWAAIFSGVGMALILVAFSEVMSEVAMPTLAAVLVAAAAGSLRTGDVLAIMRTSRTAQVAVTTTFVATLLLPIAAAVGLGIALSLLMQVNQEALDLKVIELVPTDDGRFVEQPPPTSLQSHRVVLLDIYGSLFYAGARTLQAQLPDPGGSEHPAVVLRLRGRALLGATSYVVMSDYAKRLHDVGGRLYLSGVDPEVLVQLRRNRTVEKAGDVRVFEATSTIGEASLDAYRDAEQWVLTQT